MNKKKEIELDDVDVEFVDEPWTEEERKKFSAYLRSRKALTQTRRQVWKFTTRKRKRYA